VSTKLYVEGGGDSKALKTACRKGFRMFIERAGVSGRMPRIVACGARKNAYESFATAQQTRDGSPLLLVDAEGAVTLDGPWEHLHARDGWSRPSGAGDEQCHLMVEVMESWFLADKTALAAFYGRNFQQTALPANPQIEQIPKADVLAGLEHASRNTQKGSYRKGSHSFDILAALDPTAVMAVAPCAQRLIDTLKTGAEP